MRGSIEADLFRQSGRVRVQVRGQSFREGREILCEDGGNEGPRGPLALSPGDVDWRDSIEI